MSRTVKDKENSKIININFIVLLTKKKKLPTKSYEKLQRENEVSN